MEGIECDDTLTNSYNLLQAFFTALDKHDTKAMKDIIYSKEKVGPLMHRTLLTFRRLEENKVKEKGPSNLLIA